MHRIHSRVVLRFSIRCLMVAFSAIIATLMVIVGIHTRFDWFSFVVLGLCAYFSFGWPLVDEFLVRRRYWKNHAKFIDHTATFTNESVSTTSTTADVRLNWDQLSTVIATPRGLLFLVPPHHIWLWLPQHVFDGNNQKETILSLATEHRIPVRRMA